MKNNKKVIFLIVCASVLLIEFIISRFQLKGIELKSFLEALPLAISVTGIFSEVRKRKKRESSLQSSPKNYSLNISFESSIYGGLIGGILSGIVIAFIYYYQLNYYSTNTSQLRHNSVVYLAIIPYCAVVGCIFGGLICLGRKLFSETTFINNLWANFFGCFLGCLFAGSFSGMLGMWLFADKPLPFISIDAIVIGTIIACLCLILGTLIYDYEGNPKYIFISLVSASFLSAFVSMGGYLFIGNNNIPTYLDKLMYSSNLSDQLQGGLVLGLFFGMEFGLIIGFTVLVYGYWKFAENQQKLSSMQLS